MLLGYIVGFIIILQVYTFEIFKKNPLIKVLSLLLGSFVFYALLYNVTYNSDWDAYYNKYYQIAENSDILFNIISSFYLARGSDYSNVYHFHIVLIGIGFFYFASRFSYSGILTIISIYLLFQLVAVSNQIRYFVAFPLFLIAAYNLIVRQNKFFFFLWGILSVSSHLGIILMYPFIYFYYKISSEQYFKKLILYSLVFAGSTYLIYAAFLIYVNFLHFSAYFDQSWLSSFSGGLLNSTIWILWLVYIFLKNKRLSVSHSKALETDIKYQFLYKLSLYTVIFFPASLILQILCHRYMIASLIVWIIFIIYSLQYESSLLKRLGAISIFIGLVVVTFIYQYILPRILIGNADFEPIEQIFELFYSNTFFYKFP
ncbi:MAG: EpsG family protein [Bacteroidales bacterium]|nr:EpsG family protein [Bacteroidales bacterium]